MKRFTFPLESALRIRKIQADVENAKLARLESERAGCLWGLNLLPTIFRAMQPMERNECQDAHFSSGFDVTL